jgi:hypothetical protein
MRRGCAVIAARPERTLPVSQNRSRLMFGAYRSGVSKPSGRSYIRSSTRSDARTVLLSTRTLPISPQLREPITSLRQLVDGEAANVGGTNQIVKQVDNCIRGAGKIGDCSKALEDHRAGYRRLSTRKIIEFLSRESQIKRNNAEIMP